MIKLSGKHILKFLQIHYEFVQLVFDQCKPDFIIDSNKFDTLIEEYNISAEQKISITKLIDFKFCRQTPTGEYKISGNYTDFLQFIFDDFTLDLPETMKNRYQAIFGYYTNLQTETNPDKIIALIQEIGKVIEVFLNDINRQTSRLLRDTESLKVNADNYSDLSIRIEKATFWIDEYIEPLNSIFKRDHQESFVYVITQIQRYSSEKRYLASTYRLKSEFTKLYANAVNAKAELDQTLRKLTRDLLPLLNRIKSDSIILSGFYHFVENIDYPEKYIIPLPNPIKKTKGSALSKSFSSEADFYVDQFNYKTADVYYEEQNEEIEWLPDSSYFKEQLLKEKNIENFYQWCFDILKKHTDEITLSNFFTISNLLLEDDLVVEYNDTNRFEIELSDAIIKMPKVKIYEKLST